MKDTRTRLSAMMLGGVVLLSLVLSLAAPNALIANPLSAAEYLSLPDHVARERAGALSAEETIQLLADVRQQIRPRNPDLDRVYLAIEHLESLRATQIAQKRVDRLALAVGVGLLLIVAFQLWIFLDQRRQIQSLQRWIAASPGSNDEKRTTVYRGE